MGITNRYRVQYGYKVLKRSKGLSQEELAFRVSIHRTYIGGIERGERNPSLKNIAAIANALGVTLSGLFSFGSQE